MEEEADFRAESGPNLEDKAPSDDLGAILPSSILIVSRIIGDYLNKDYFNRSRDANGAIAGGLGLVIS